MLIDRQPTPIPRRNETYDIDPDTPYPIKPPAAMNPSSDCYRRRFLDENN